LLAGSWNDQTKQDPIILCVDCGPNGKGRLPLWEKKKTLENSVRENYIPLKNIE
jgi:hypothetical protein